MSAGTEKQRDTYEGEVEQAISDSRSLFMLGGTGFIGSELVSQARSEGWRVRALARSAESEGRLESGGAQPIRAEAEDGRQWAHSARGADALIDLVQPPFPKRLSDRAVARIADQRLAVTRGVLEALGSLPETERPLLFFASGVDDLLPDPSGAASDRSAANPDPSGLSRVGVSVRRLIESSELDATYVYFGVMVYGAGKVFADVYVEGMKKRRAPVLGQGDNRLPLTHVTDAARAFLHLAGQPRDRLAGRTFVAADGNEPTQRELLDYTAELMGVKRPRSIPASLASIVAGRAAVEAMTLDMHPDPSALLETGFEFRYPSYKEGVPQVLSRLGAGSPLAGG